MTIQAIPTWQYGIKFRSRLEARWAIFFTEYGLAWEYERAGYALNGNPYLPDFYLDTFNACIEIKPRSFASKADDDPEWIRLQIIESLWNAKATQLPPLYILCGVPSYAIMLGWLDECFGDTVATLAECRRCAGLCYVGNALWGNVGTHKGCDSEKEPCETSRIKMAAKKAMEAQFEHKR